MKPFVSWSRIIQNICGWGLGSRVCVVGGKDDKIVSVSIAKANAFYLKEAFGEQVKRRKVDGMTGAAVEDAIRFIVVEKAPHHLQNDLCREDAARQVLEFLNGLG